jgi:mono/diheme cytochrome c family protein
MFEEEDPMRARLGWGWAGLAAAAIVAIAANVTQPLANAAAASAEPAQAAKSRPPDGASLYVAYCASCHGRTGHGDGPVAQYLRIPPTDLTRIAERANGVFPAYQVRRIIDGRQIVRAHGDAAMPVWGDAFQHLAPELSDAEVVARINALVKYLEAMQPRQASNSGGAPAVAR